MNAARRLLASNRALAGFFLKMGVVYAAWFVLYDLWLLPDGRLDAALSRAVVALTAGVLQPLYHGAAADGRVVRVGTGAGIRIEDGCNGLAALSLFVGFVVAYPGEALRRLLFIPLGLTLIGAANVLRCASLVIAQEERPALFAFAHAYPSPLVFYAVIFALWVAWAHFGGGDRSRGAGAAGAAGAGADG